MMNKPKAVLFDLDGTLLNSNKEIFSTNIGLIESCIQHGLIVGLATARPLNFIRHKLSPELNSKLWKLCHNGAQVFTGNDTCIFSESIPKSSIEKIIYHTKGNCLSLSWYMMSKWISSTVLDQYLLSVYGISPDYELPTILPLESLYKADSAEKILIVDHTDHLRFIDRLKDEVSINITSDSSLLMISAKNTSKMHSAQKFLEFNKLSWHDLIVFGDDFNDEIIFRMPCFSVAMGNATESLKELANTITLDNNNPHAFENILLDLL